MKKNVGTLDRIIRVIIAIVFGYLYFAKIITGAWGIVLLMLGLIFLFTAIVGHCALYVPFGISTCTKKDRDKKE